MFTGKLLICFKSVYYYLLSTNRIMLNHFDYKLKDSRRTKSAYIKITQLLDIKYYILTIQLVIMLYSIIYFIQQIRTSTIIPLTTEHNPNKTLLLLHA